jgi:hypothetical protein
MKFDPFSPFTLTPKKTIKVCEEITKRWPADGSLPEPTDDLAERNRVRELVRKTMPGVSLYLTDALIAVNMAIDVSEAQGWRDHAVNVLASRPKPLAFDPLYTLYQYFYDHINLRNTVSGQYVHLDKKPFPEASAQSIFGENPVDRIVIVAFRHQHSIAALSKHFGFRRSAPLTIQSAHICYKQVIDNPLGDLEKPWLLAHSLVELLLALETRLTTTHEHLGFLGAIVRVYGVFSWKYEVVANHPILPKIFERITQKDMLWLPDERPSAWQSDPEIANLVRRWLNDQKIKDFFDSVDAEPARKIFWRRAVSVIDEIQSYHPYFSAFAMRIGSIWFVEFGETGNACYPYESQEYQNLQYRWRYLPPDKKYKSAYLKEKQNIYLPVEDFYYYGYKEYGVGDGRLTHAPTWSTWATGWHQKFEAYIETFCDVTLE